MRLEEGWSKWLFSFLIRPSRILSASRLDLFMWRPSDSRILSLLLVLASNLGEFFGTCSGWGDSSWLVRATGVVPIERELVL